MYIVLSAHFTAAQTTQTSTSPPPDPFVKGTWTLNLTTQYVTGVPDGTNFNFTPQFGLGATYQLSDNTFLIGGARLFHLSNAGIDPGVNPSINLAIEGYVGLLFKL
jgi:Lipid A 3-O-deacylase (PagL)